MPVFMSMMPGTPMPIPCSAALLAILGGKQPDGIAHLADDVVFAQRYPRAQRDFFHQVALLVDGRDAQIGSAEIDADRKVGHR